MGEYHIKGGVKLSGEIDVAGGKNAVLPILAATVLVNGVSVIHNCPMITDTKITIRILESLGCNVKIEGRTVIVDSRSACNTEVPGHMVKEMRSSIIFLGCLLGRFNKVKISYPGGCELGDRPIDLHVKGIGELGAWIVDEHDYLFCSAGNLKGNDINLDFPSVGATENIMLAAVFAEGETRIINSAKEPEILELQKFLNSAGADISGAGSDTIVIKGIKKLHDVEHTVMPDRIVAGTYLVAAAITKGNITLRNPVYEHLSPIISKLKETGCEFYEEGSLLHMKSPKRLKPIHKLRTHPHPGFPTDMQAPMMALLCIANGTSVINETIFDSRYKHAFELMRMGADIILSRDGKTAFVTGVSQLKGTTVEAKDLRGGAALILAGLAAEGLTIVNNSKHVERGYEKIESDLASLGADIQYLRARSVSCFNGFFKQIDVLQGSVDDAYSLRTLGNADAEE